MIVCEGETEEGYFDAARAHFNLTTAEVMIADNTKGPAPISVVDCAEELGIFRPLKGGTSPAPWFGCLAK